MKKKRLRRFDVTLISKNGSATATMRVMAVDEKSAIDEADRLIENDPEYARFKRGWQIEDAIEDE